MAIFPLMSRFARQESDNLLRSYMLSLRLLTIVSLPIAMAVTFLAGRWSLLVGGAQYLNVPGRVHVFGHDVPYMGGADLAFQVIIWSIPIGFVNSVTQYVLIAVNQQHYLTRAFIMGVVFNVVGNLILIPRLGYVGAALATILSEFSLLVPVLLQRAAQCGRGAVGGHLPASTAGDGRDGSRGLRVDHPRSQSVGSGGARDRSLSAGALVVRRAAWRRDAGVAPRVAARKVALGRAAVSTAPYQSRYQCRRS